MREKFFRIYRSETETHDFLGKATVFLADRPGSLARFASHFAKYRINISYFYYNRSEHPNRVLLEVTSIGSESLKKVYRELSEQKLLEGEMINPQLELGVIDTANILKIEVQLENRPGTLGKFATLLSKHNANVMFMLYNEEVSETSAHISLATKDSQEIDRLLKDMNEKGYHYSVVYKGAQHREVEDIIGLNLVERFFFRLKKLLNTSDIERLKKLVASSQRITDTLTRFSREAGKHLEEGEVFTKVLAFASTSLSKTGSNFTFRQLPSLPFGNITFHTFRLPTGGNTCILESDEECVMVDGGYGLYYEDVKKMLEQIRLDPARITRMYLTHPDADHAGMSGYFEEEFGSKVFLHHDAKGIIENENRAWGTRSPLHNLNNYFTILVNEFTQARYPKHWVAFGDTTIEHEDGFPVIDVFEIAGQTYKVLCTKGGHMPGQVFFVSYDSGLVFTGDFLLSVQSLSPGDRELLNIPKFMMTSTNVDSFLFRQEMDALQQFIIRFDGKLRAHHWGALVVPGHGDYYPASRLR